MSDFEEQFTIATKDKMSDLGIESGEITSSLRINCIHTINHWQNHLTTTRQVFFLARGGCVDRITLFTKILSNFFI